MMMNLRDPGTLAEALRRIRWTRRLSTRDRELELHIRRHVAPIQSSLQVIYMSAVRYYRHESKPYVDPTKERRHVAAVWVRQYTLAKGFLLEGNMYDLVDKKTGRINWQEVDNRLEMAKAKRRIDDGI